ncbi:uncharacterized protein LOC116117745 isoform X2 [Pistacia vera]|uniref:uncharacterized protein LOC116117745 isoform X2 n=1 Tax=Pistacia vera TaxID=55513 RepID=UPI001263E50E|nr:uncharacterized protein LOC116117745 isoform X2 [Pistacia vera]
MEEKKNEGPILYSSMVETSLRDIYCNKKKLLADETGAESSGFHIFLCLGAADFNHCPRDTTGEERQVKERNVRLWLDQLKDTSYDIDNVLDEWNCTLLKQRIEGVENALVPNKRRNSNIMVQHARWEVLINESMLDEEASPITLDPR